MIKICGKIVSHFIHFATIFSGAIFITLNTDIGRREICRLASAILSKHFNNFVHLHGWNGNNFVKNFTYKNIDGSSVELHGLQFKYNKKLSINVNKIVIKSSDKKSDLRVILDNISVGINMFRKYINNLKTSTIEYNSEEFKFHDVEVTNTANILSLIGEINDGKVAIFLSSNDNKIDSIDIQIEKLCNANGKITVKDCHQDEAKIFADLSYLDNKITINGTSQDITKNTFCQIKCKLEDGSLANFDGNFSIPDKKATGKLSINSKIIDTIFCQDNKDLLMNIKGDFGFNGSIKANFSINNDKQNIASGSINGRNKYTISGNILGNLPYEIKLKSFLFDIDSETKTITCKLNGDNWSTTADTTLRTNIIEINNFSFYHKDCDISMSEPIIIKDKDIASGRLSIDCRDTRFLSDIFGNELTQYTSGAFIGNLYVSDGYKVFDILTDKISIKNVDIYGASIKQKDKNFWIKFNGFEFQNSMFSDFDFSYIDGKFSAKCDIDTDGKFLLNGETKDNKNYTLSEIKFLTKNVNFLAKKIQITHNTQSEFSCLCDNISINNGHVNLYYLSSNDKLTIKTNLTKIPCKLLSCFNKSINSKVIDGLYISANFDLYENNSKSLLGKIQTKIEDANNEIFALNGQLDNSELNLKANYSRTDSKINIDGCIPICFSLRDKTTKNLSKDLNLKCKSAIDLKNIFAFSDDFSLTGKLNSNLDIKGTMSKPLLNGNVNFVNGSIETSAISVKNIDLKLTANNNNIEIKKCFANDKHGTMQITGKAKLNISNDTPKLILDTNLTFLNFELVNSEAIKLTFDGTIKANGPIDKLLISGPITLTKGIYDSSFANKTLHSDIRIIRAGKRPKQLTIKQNNIKLPVIFDIDTDCKMLKVIGDSIESTFSGPVKIVSFNDELSMDGAFNLDSGYIKMLGIRVPLRYGKILFKKDKPLTPEVSLLGNTFVRDMQLFIDVNNKNDNKLAINIYSKPAYSIDNILSKIIFNKPSQELRIEESTKIHEAIKNLTNQESAFSLFDTLKDLMFFDTVSISNNNENSTNKDSHTISAGKYLSNNIYVGVDKTSEKEAKYKVRVNLSPQVTVETNSVGEAGISWVYRY